MYPAIIQCTVCIHTLPPQIPIILTEITDADHLTVNLSRDNKGLDAVKMGLQIRLWPLDLSFLPDYCKPIDNYCSVFTISIDNFGYPLVFF